MRKQIAWGALLFAGLLVVGGTLQVQGQQGVAGTPRDEALNEEMFAAITHGDKGKVEALIAQGFNVNAGLDTHDARPLQIAARAGRKDVAALLISKGANVNAKDNEDGTPLHDAARNVNKDVAELLIAKGADVNARDGVGYTPLERAIDSPLIDSAEWMRKGMVELLVAKGANITSDAMARADRISDAKERQEIKDILRSAK